MSDSPAARPIWLTEAQRDALSHSSAQIAQLLVDAWDAAPADATEALGEAMAANEDLPWPEFVRAVLAALGAPK